MPLNTQILRNGKPVKVPWDDQMLSFMYTTAFVEGDPSYEYEDGKIFAELGTYVLEGTGTKYDGQEFEHWVSFAWAPIYYLKSKCTLVKSGSQTVKRQHRFFHRSGKVITLKPGDVLEAWRSFKS